MSGTYTALRSAIVTAIQTVTDIGNVYNRLRYASEPQTYLSLFKTTIAGEEQIRAWIVTAADPHIEVDEEQSTFGTFARRYNFQVHAYQGFKDSSDTEGTLYDLVEDVIKVLDTQTTFGVAGVVVRAIGPCVVQETGHRQFGSEFTNYARISFSVVVDEAI